MNKILLLLFLLPIFSFGQTTKIITTTGTGTFIVPCDVTSITVEAWGAGGAGGGSGSNNSKGGGGGAGGSYVSSVLVVTAGQIINYNVGAGSIGINGDGATGEGSWVYNNTTVFAQGGAGGAAPNGGTVSGGTGSISSSIGNVKIAGVNGSNGTSTVGGKGGNGGNSGGNGGASISNEGNGNSGNQPGGGGGGALIPDKTNHSGGNGGNGQINITYTSSQLEYCTPSFTWGISPITNVTFAGINNTTSNSTSSNSIESFCIVGSVVQGSSTNSISTKGNTVGNYTQSIYAFIDWDQNGVLGNNSNEIYNLGAISNSTGVDAIVVSSNIAVPTSALLGTTKMRIIQRDVNTSNPCYSSNDYGQAEDYQITVTAPVPTITSFSPAAGCVGSTITINGTNFTGATAANVKIGGTAVSSITSITATQIVAVIGSGTTGKVTVTNLGGTATSASNFTVYNLLSNNNLSYTNGTSGQINATPAENGNAVLAASSGTYFSNVAFASYGSPNGTSPNFTLGSCHAITSQSVTESYLLGNNSATIPATNVVFGDPCSGTVKRLYVLASYVEPICNGGTVTITGSAPVGGDSTYTYLWESSTTSASTGFTSATGTNNTINYTSGSITQTTWFRRTVYSCTINNTSSVTMIKVNPVIANNTITASQAICSGTSPSGLVGTTPTGGNSVYTYLWESSTTSATTGFTTATGTNNTINYSPGVLATNTWFRRKVTSGSCINYSTAISITINPTTSITSQSTATQTKCIGSAFLPITVTASGTGLTYQWYSTTSNSNSGGISLASANGAQTNSYTPQSTVSGTLYYYCIVTGTCGPSVTSLVSGAFITNGNTGISSQSTATQTKCIGSAFLPITVTASGTSLTYQWYSTTSNSNSGGTSLASANGAQTNSYTPQSTVSGTLYYYSIVTGTCGSSVTSLVSGAFITNPIPTVPSVGTVTQPDCVISKGSVVLSGLPTSGTISQTGTSTSSYAITGTTMTISGLATGTYQFSASNGSCASVSTGNVVINSAVTNTWNGSVWSNGTPTLSDKIVFSGNYPPASDPNVDIEGCSCKVSGSTTVVFKAGRTLKIKNEVDVQVTGALIFESGASLVQINDTPSTPNSGNIIYKRETTPISNFDYTYWSSPVASQTLYNLSPNTLGDKFYSFDSGIDNWRQENSSSTMAIGTGYIVRGPQNYSAPTPPNIYLASFIGVPNNGVKNTAIGVAGNSNLIGNPYPSALDADSFLTANSGVLEGTIYFWTHNTNIGIGVSNPGSGTYAYSSDDYAAYNLTGGVATQAPSSSNAGAVNSNAPSGKIASGQAFFGTSIASGNAVFKNNMRVGVGSITGDNSQFFKNASNAKAVTTIEKDRLWLNFYNSQDAFKQTLVGYVTGATNEYDSAFDGESFDSNEFLDFYSINLDKNLVIQGRALPFDQADEVPLGYSSTIVGDFEIAIGQVDGSLVGKDVFLEDKLLNTTHNLKKDPYLFKTESGVFNDRFIIKYTNKTLATDVFEDIKYGVSISNKNKEILIKSSDEPIDKVFVYDFSGKQLYKKINISNNEYKIINLGPIDQALIIKVILQNGKTVNNKIVY